MNLERSRAIPTTVFAHLTTEQLTSKLVSYLPEIKQSPESFMKKETHHFSWTFLNQRAKKETTDAHQNFKRGRFIDKTISHPAQLYRPQHAV